MSPSDRGCGWGFITNLHNTSPRFQSWTVYLTTTRKINKHSYSPSPSERGWGEVMSPSDRGCGWGSHVVLGSNHFKAHDFNRGQFKQQSPITNKTEQFTFKLAPSTSERGRGCGFSLKRDVLRQAHGSIFGPWCFPKGIPSGFVLFALSSTSRLGGSKKYIVK